MKININFGGFFIFLGLAFIVLKLCKVIAWSWWLVLFPIYGGLLFGILVLGFFVLVAAWVSK